MYGKNSSVSPVSLLCFGLRLNNLVFLFSRDRLCLLCIASPVVVDLVSLLCRELAETDRDYRLLRGRRGSINGAKTDGHPGEGRRSGSAEEDPGCFVCRGGQGAFHCSPTPTMIRYILFPVRCPFARRLSTCLHCCPFARSPFHSNQNHDISETKCITSSPSRRSFAADPLMVSPFPVLRIDFHVCRSPRSLDLDD